MWIEGSANLPLYTFEFYSISEPKYISYFEQNIHELLDPFVFSNKYKFIQVNLKEFVGKNSACLVNLMHIVRFTNMKTFK